LNLDEAREVVMLLADGVDPLTGEVLPDRSPYNDPKVIRALFTILNPPKDKKPAKKTREQKQQENVAAGRPRNAGLPWTEDLKEELAQKFMSGASVDELVRYFERTKGAIQYELVKQGLIEESEAE